MDEVLTEYLEQATDMINQDRGRDFFDANGNAPRGIENIAYRLAANMVIRQKARQNVLNVSRLDYNNEMATSDIFTWHIARDLLMWPAAPKLGIMRVRTPADRTTT